MWLLLNVWIIYMLQGPIISFQHVAQAEVHILRLFLDLIEPIWLSSSRGVQDVYCADLMHSHVLDGIEVINKFPKFSSE